MLQKPDHSQETNMHVRWETDDWNPSGVQSGSDVSAGFHSGNRKFPSTVRKHSLVLWWKFVLLVWEVRQWPQLLSDWEQNGSTGLTGLSHRQQKFNKRYGSAVISVWVHENHFFYLTTKQNFRSLQPQTWTKPRSQAENPAAVCSYTTGNAVKIRSNKIQLHLSLHQKKHEKEEGEVRTEKCDGFMLSQWAPLKMMMMMMVCTLLPYRYQKHFTLLLLSHTFT